jgi:ankyrin repeat protein
MNSQLTAVVNGEVKEYSFFEALSFEPKEPCVLLSPEELGLSSSPRKVPTSTSQSNPTKTKSTLKMAASKAQTQCLELCHKTISLIDRISVRILENLTSSKQLPHGFETLAHDFLDTCQILFSIEAGLGECNRTGKKFPPEMITELGYKFRVTQADFHILDQLLDKFLGRSTLMKRGWGKIFDNTDIKKITTALAKTRESLRMSSLVFQWNLGNEKLEIEKGIGYTGLAAALDKMDYKVGNGKASVNGNGNVNGNVNGNINGNVNGNPNGNSSHYQLLSVAPLGPPPSAAPPPPGVMDSQNIFQQQEQPPLPLSNRSSSIKHEGSVGRASGRPNIRPPLSPDFRQNSTTTTLATSPGSNERHYLRSTDTYDRASIMDDTHSLTGIAEYDNFLEDIVGMELGSSKVVRHMVDPTAMPRCYPRSAADSDSPNVKSALISAVRGKNHKLVEQLLNRGVSANAGPNGHALKEAIFAHDQESVRLLLLYGADPNDPDRDGITPLFAAVEKSFLAGATILLKYGADPNLVAGPDLESPLATTVIANLTGFSHLLLTYNGDANHITASGNTLLIGATKKKTSKKLISLLLDYGSDPNAKSRDGRTALFESIQVGRADIVTSLLEHGANPNLPGPKHMLWPATYHPACLEVLLSHGADSKKSPGIMELAVSINNIESVRILLKAGVDPNTKKDGTYTPLCTAIRDDRAELLQLLLSNGADPNVMASEYPAFKCITHNRVHFLPLLVAAGADLHTPKGILETAISTNNMEALYWLLDQGVNLNDKSPKGDSPLSTAIRENRFDIVDLLLLRGADPHMRGQDWPLCMAVRNPPILKRILSVVPEPQAFKGVMEMAASANQLESVKLLIAAGVSVEDKNGGVFSPLTTAIREDRREIVSYLLSEGGADVNAPGEHLPIVKALRRYHGNDTEIMELLLKHGADPNKIYRGWNAVMQAIENGDTDVLRLLSQKAGVDLEVEDEMGRNVVDMAASRGWTEAVQILTDRDIRLKK